MGCIAPSKPVSLHVGTGVLALKDRFLGDRVNA